MANLLFSPSGRIGPSAFLKGMGIVAVVSALFHLFMFKGIVWGYGMMFLAFVLLFYPMLALLIKRLHDSGKSGWLGLLFLILMVVIYFIITSFIGGMFAKDEALVFQEAMLELQGNVVTPEEQFAIMGEAGDPYAKKLAIPVALLAAVSIMLGAFLVNLILKQDAHENQYGHPPAA